MPRTLSAALAASPSCARPRPIRSNTGSAGSPLVPALRLVSSWAARLSLLLACLGLLAPLNLPAQDASTGTGTIEGRVLNADTGKYVSRARVTVEGTNIESFTNSFGEYTLTNVPAGLASVKVYYTGKAPQTAEVVVAEGGTAQQDFSLAREAARTDDGAVVLEEFVVDTERFESAAQLAINEERFAPNIKNVVSTDAFGHIAQGNVGEFVKYLPGVLIGYGGGAGTGSEYSSGADATRISVRGFRSSQTAVYVDGMPIANAEPGSLSRSVSLDLLSINQASRVELTKVPTPDMPMDSPGGSINLITKTAFEYAKPEFNVDVFFNLNSENLDFFKKTPGPANKKTYKTLPNVVLEYIRPVNEKIGFAVTAASYNQYNENQRADISWVFDADDIQHPDGYFVDARHPFIEDIEIRDRPRTEHRNSLSFRTDYRPWDGTTVSASYTLTLHEATDVERISAYKSEEVDDWGDGFSIGTPGEGEVQQIVRSLDRDGITHSGQIKLTHRKGPWDIFASFATSKSDAKLLTTENGHFSEVELNMVDEDQVIFEDIYEGVPRTIRVISEEGQPMDASRLEHYGVDLDEPLMVRAGNMDSTNLKDVYKVDVRRQLDFLPGDFRDLAIKVGYYREENIEKKAGRGVNSRYVYTGPIDTFDIHDYLDESYTEISPGFGFPGWQWVDLYKLYDLYESNPDYFSDDSDDTTYGGAEALGTFESVAANNWREFLNTNKYIKETADAWYVQLEGTFFDNRLSAVGGVRGESTARKGRAPKRDRNWQYVQTPDGIIWRDDELAPSGIRVDRENSVLFADTPEGEELRSRLTAEGISFPTSWVIPKSLAAIQREYPGLHELDDKSSGKPSYSLNLAYNVTEQLVAKLGYAKQFGRVDYEDGIIGGRIEFNQNASNPDSGSIIIGNPELEPEISDNYDLALAYYTKNGGKFGISYFWKTVDNFHIEQTTTLTETNYEALLQRHGLTPLEDYIGWDLRTTEMGVGTAKTYGFEFEVSQQLSVLAPWARDFWVFANYSTQRKSANQDATGKLGATAENYGAGGIAYDSKRWSIRLNATWRDDNITDDEAYPLFEYDPVEDEAVEVGETVIFEYEPAEWRLDASIAYKISERYSIYASGRNITNTKTIRKYFDSEGLLPEYAMVYDNRNFGFQWTFGVQASF